MIPASSLVVVGGGIAALTAAQTLRSEGFEGRVVMLSDEDRGTYTRVPLSKAYLRGDVDADALDLLGSTADFDVHLSRRAVALDRGGRCVLTDRGAVHFDGLLIATGARARRLGTPDQDELTLRTIADADRLRSSAEPGRSVVIVGGGVLGMETASTLCFLGLSVTVIDVRPHMDRMLGPVVATHLRRAATAHGVTLVDAPGGVRLLGSPRIVGVQHAGGTLEADLVVTAAGDVPNVEWLQGSGLATRSGLVVDDRCIAAPGVVAAGDVATVEGGGRNATWTGAIEQGRTAALSMLHGGDAPKLRPSRYQWTEQFGLDIKMVGQPPPASEPTTLEGSLDGGHAVLTWADENGVSTVMSYAAAVPLARLRRLLTTARAP